MKGSTNAMGVLWASPRKQEEALRGIRSDEIRPIYGIIDSSGGLGITVEEGKMQGEASERFHNTSGEVSWV